MIVATGGVEAGERICITPLPEAVDGMRVRVLGDTPATGTGAVSGASS